jgi:hypothetical protein
LYRFDAFFCLMMTLKLHILANILWYRIIHWTLSLITNATAVCCYWCEISMCKVGAAGAFTEMSAWWWLLVTETCRKLYIIEYIVVFWLNDFLVIHRIGYFSEEKRCWKQKDLKKFSYCQLVNATFSCFIEGCNTNIFNSVLLGLKLNSIIFKFQYYLRQYMFVALNNGSCNKEILLELLVSQIKITKTAVGN